VVIPVVNIADRISRTTLTVDRGALPLRGERFRVTDRFDGSVIVGPSGAAWTAQELESIPVVLAAFQARFLEVVPA
jgi:hypothetical protein